MQEFAGVHHPTLKAALAATEDSQAALQAFQDASRLYRAIGLQDRAERAEQLAASLTPASSR